MGNDGSESILDTYLYETGSLLEQLDSIVLAAEQADTFSENDVNEIFRIMHTIKGASAMMEYDSLSKTAHRLEDLFFIIRENGMDVVAEETRPALFDLIFQSIDYFRQEVEKLEDGQPLTDNIDQLLEKINSLIAKIQGGETQAAVPAPKAPAEASPEKAGEGAFPYTLRVFFDEGVGMENLRAFMLLTEIQNICGEEDFTYFPAGVESEPETAETIISQGFLLSFRNPDDQDKAAKVAAVSGSVREYQAACEQTAAPASAAAAAEAPAARKKSGGDRAPAARIAPESGAAQPVQHARENLISVNLSKLNHLMDVVGEIVITESMLTASSDLKDLKLDNFNKSARQLRKLTDELQDVAMSLRMVPLLATFQKMQRIVRDMGRKLDKRVSLTLEGEDTEVDKTVVDNIGDPLMHIVRNAMDHGIEDSEEDRIAAGKDPVGEIVLSAAHTGGEVVIQVRDDGRGVDLDKVLKKAVDVGLAGPEMEYSEKEILNFLLMPGFSTNTQVTEFSGRGVGMDVVKKNVEEVGGTVSISSVPGQGMTTTLRIPLTMAIMDGMEVSVGKSLFTIPIHNIRQSFRMNGGDIIHNADGGELVRIMDTFYPIVRVKDAYSLSDGRDSLEEGILMWVESGECSYCLFVDELLGEQQVVVKPLPNYINAFGIKQHGITGCTILGDGTISMILDVANLYSAEH